jgi:hypothetical protein
LEGGGRRKRLRRWRTSEIGCGWTSTTSDGVRKVLKCGSEVDWHGRGFGEERVEFVGRKNKVFGGRCCEDFSGTMEVETDIKFSVCI